MIACASCGALPVGTYSNGEPRFPLSCDHPPIFPGDPRWHDPRGSEAPEVGVDQYGRVIVELDAFEMTEAYACGKKRFDQSTRRKSKDHFDTPSVESHILGAQGERAFAKWLGEPWECTTRRYGASPDIRGCQVRTASAPKLPVKVRDSDGHRTPVVSIVANAPRFWLRGWIMAGEAKRHPEWIDDPGGRSAPAFFVPTPSLQPMSSFYASNAVRAALGIAPLGV